MQPSQHELHPAWRWRYHFAAIMLLIIIAILYIYTDAGADAAEVEYISCIDGDTCYFREGFGSPPLTVRLSLIDAAELGSACYPIASQQKALLGLLLHNATQIQMQHTRYDIWGRSVAHIIITHPRIQGGKPTNLSRYLIQQDLVTRYRKGDSCHINMDTLRSAFMRHLP